MTVHSRIKFDAASHTYTLDGKPMASVTSVVKRLVPKFDAAGNAARVAAREGKTAEQVLAEWEAKGQAAMAKGKQVHAAVEAAVKGERRAEPCRLKEFVAWLGWWAAAGAALEPRGVEKVVGDAELGVAGTIDLLAHSHKTGKLHVLDYKTGAKFETGNAWGRTLLPPFEDAPDCELHRYSLQLSLYRLILERDGETGKLGDGWLLHLDGKATPHRVVDYRKRLEKWLEKR